MSNYYCPNPDCREVATKEPCEHCGRHANDILDEQSSHVKCVGKGNRGDGCGYTGGRPGGTCPHCNGMLLSESDIEEADKLAEAWDAEERGATLIQDEW